MKILRADVMRGGAFSDYCWAHPWACLLHVNQIIGCLDTVSGVTLGRVVVGARQLGLPRGGVEVVLVDNVEYRAKAS